MNFFDIVIFVFFIYVVYKGFKYGFIIELFMLLVILVGIYVGIYFFDGVVGWLKKLFGWDFVYFLVIVFIIIFLGVGVMIYFGGKVLEKMIRVVNFLLFNKVVGVVFVIIKVFYIVFVVLVMIEFYDEKGNFFLEKFKVGLLLY